MFCVAATGDNKPVPHHEQHKTQSDFWSAVRMKPVTITEIKGDTVYWSFEDTHTVDLGSFVTDEYTKGKPEVGKKFLVVYCEAHHVAYEFVLYPKDLPR
jgi:hypothetical protein